jgi:phosphatidate cytidylyltransferase
MAPIALGAVWVGTALTAPLVACAVGVMGWEWGRLIGRATSAIDAALFIGTGAAAVLAAGFISVGAGLAVAALGIAALILRDPRLPHWTGFGMGWVVLPAIGFLWLRSDPVAGLATALWILALVWTIDTTAYAVGRALGGPKLAPWISPNKTWSGLLGGVVGALVVGAAAGWLVGSTAPWLVALVSGGLAVVEQIGDIAESYAKRRFGAKDSGTLIPGHGGALDRLDGMLAVITAVVLMQVVTGGSILIWR